MMNFTIEGNIVAQLERFGEAAEEVGEKLTDAVFDAAKEWMDEVKEELADKFAEEMMEVFEELEKSEKEHEEMAKETLLEGTIGGAEHKEGASEGNSEGGGKEEKTTLEKAGEFAEALTGGARFSNIVPNAEALFRIVEKEGSKTVELTYDPGRAALDMLPGLLSQNRTGQKQLFDAVMMAKRATPLTDMAGSIVEGSGAVETGEGGEGGGEGGAEGGEGAGGGTEEEGGESTGSIMRDDTIFISRALHKATYEVVASKEQALETQINKKGSQAIRELLAAHGF